MPYKPGHPARHKGRFAIVTKRGPGCGGCDGVGTHANCRAGESREQRPARYDTALTASSHGLDSERTPAVENPARMRADGEVVWSRRPGFWRQAFAVMWRPTGARIDQPQDDGGNSATLPEESRKDTVKTIAQGRPDVPASPVVHPVRFL
jgi:hypothetical protein